MGAGLALLSGIGLVALLVTDLRKAIANQESRVREVAQRDAQRGARELVGALRNPAVLEAIPDPLRFALVDGALVIPTTVGWLDKPPAFSPQADLDAVALDHLRRAERASGELAGELWRLFLSDPTLRRQHRAWALLRVAWFAERTGNGAWRDELLGQLERAQHDAPRPWPAELGASRLLLAAHAGKPAPPWAKEALTRLTKECAAATLRRLGEFGQETREAEQALQQAQTRRGVLRSIQPLAAELASLGEPQQRAAGGGLVLFFPRTGRGARLEQEHIAALVDTLKRTGLGGAPPLNLGGALHFGEASAEVVRGLFGIEPRVELGGRLTSGPVGLALLTVALAAIMGAGVLGIVRSSRREAQAARVRSEFVTSVTHELKTPLAGIRLTAELLADGHVRDDAKRQAYLVRLGGEAQRLGNLIENVLDLGRLERGERGLSPERIELVEFTRETLALFEPLASSANIDVHFSTEEREAIVHMDRDALRQAFLNVLDNARKYGGERGTIHVGLVRSQAGTRLWVQDSGPGVLPEERESIFQRFRRGEAQQDGHLPGLGLGLFIARTLLRGGGGDLLCRATKDKPEGAHFEFWLPAATDREPS